MKRNLEPRPERGHSCPLPPFEARGADKNVRAPFPHVLVKRLARIQTIRDWWFKECRDGGYLERYIRREKHQMPDRVRAVARKFVDWKQPTKTDFQLRAAIPARLFHRLKGEDPHFFEDNQNLRNLKRDNPDVVMKL